MAATPEKKVKDQIKALCKKHGAYVVMPVMTGYANNGTPDFLLCLDTSEVSAVAEYKIRRTVVGVPRHHGHHDVRAVFFAQRLDLLFYFLLWCSGHRLLLLRRPT